MTIYKITNKINGKIYIGQTIRSIKRRFDEHFYKSHNKNNYPLFNAMKKYGKNAFCMEKVIECNSLEELNRAEEYYVNLYNSLAPNGYNLHTGGGNHICSEATKKKISKAGMGRIVTEKTRAKISAAQAGGKNPFLGKKHSEESKKKMSIAKLGKRHTNTKRIVCIETGRIFSSVGEASKSLSIHMSTISSVLNGRRRSINGLTFKHIDKNIGVE